MSRAFSYEQIEYSLVRDCDIDLGHPPVTVTLSTPRFDLILSLMLLAVFVGLYIFVPTDDIEIGWIALAALGGFFLVIMPVADYRHWTVTLSSDWIDVKGWSWRGREDFSMPYTEFTGVLRITRFGLEGRNIVNAIVLNHTDSRKSTPLFQGSYNAILSPRDKWKAYARTLRLPTQEETPEGIITHQLGDLDKSVKELAKKGKLPVQFDRSLAPPKGLAVEFAPDGDRQIRAVRMKRSAIWRRAPGVEIVAGAIAIRGVGKKGEAHLPFRDIESVQSLGDDANRMLVISTAEEEITLGEGLSDEALLWLRDFILAAIIEG